MKILPMRLAAKLITHAGSIIGMATKTYRQRQRLALYAAYFLVAAGPVLAAPYPSDGLKTVWTQPDGVKLELRVFGDEFYGRTQNDAGYTVIYHPEDGSYRYAELSSEGTALVPSAIQAHLPPPAGLAKGIKLPVGEIRKVANARRQIFEAGRSQRWQQRVQAVRREQARAAGLLPQPNTSGERAAAQQDQIVAAPVSGKKVGLTLLLQFPDDASTAASDPINFPTTYDKIERFCNQLGYTDDGNSGSVRDYFADQSLKALDYTQALPQIVTLPKARNYYNFSDYPNNKALRDAGLAGRLLIEDAITVLKNAGFDPSQVTRDETNKIVATSVLFAGNDSGVWAQGLWPHAWVMSAPSEKTNIGSTSDPLYIYAYQITNIEDNKPVIGTFIHENGHLLLEYPDLYDYDDDSSGVGNHCLMGGGNYNNGGKTPSPLNAYFKDMVGWANVVDFTASQAALVDVPSTGNVAYRIRKPGLATEFFIVENRGEGDKWAGGSPDKGIAIWHIDDAKSGNDEQEMTPTKHYQVSLEQADGEFDLENNRGIGDATDMFDLAKGFFNDSTLPNAKWWDGSSSGIKISVLGMASPTIKVRFGDAESMPDLTDPGTNRTVSTESVSVGGTLGVTGNVKNQGDAASTTFVVRYYLSQDNAISATDYYLGEKSFAGLAAGATSPLDQSGLVVPATIPTGTYTIGWIIDAANSVNESNETNNSGYVTGKQVTVVPDLSSDDAYEENDNSEKAYDLTTSEKIWLSAVKGHGIQRDDDWFKIRVRPGFTQVRVECTFDHNKGDLDIQLVSLDGALLASSTGSSDVEMIDLDVAKHGILNGELFVRVFFSNAGNRYDLQWEARPLPISTDSTLQSLALSEGNLSPAFTPSTKAYTARVPYATTAINVTPLAAAAVAQVRVNTQIVPYGASSSQIPLGLGINKLAIPVKAQNGSTTTYQVVVIRDSKLRLSNVRGTVPAAARSGITVQVFAPGTWSAVSNQPWLGFSTASGGAGGAPMVMTVEANTTNQARSAQITVASAGQFALYTLTQLAPDDHGNAPASATELVVNGVGEVVRGGILQPSDVDWLRIPISSQSSALFSFTGLSGQVFSIYKANNLAAPWLTTTIPVGATQSTVSAILPKGVVFVRVSGTAGTFSVSLHSRFSSDFNGDRKNDLLWQHSGTNQMSLWHMNFRGRLGQSVFSSQTNLTWRLVNHADMNGDIKPDLVLQNVSNGDVVLWNLNGIGLASSGPLNIQMGSPQWQVAGVNDMNADGMVDVIYQNSDSGNVQVRYLNRSRQVIGSADFPEQMDADFRLCGLADANGDGYPDAVWQNRTSGAIQLTYLQNLTIKAGGGALLTQPGSALWQVCALDDRNGDGMADLALQNTVTGEVLVWCLNGRSVLANGGPLMTQQGSNAFVLKNSRPILP